MVFLSLLLSTELSVLFNSAEITTHVRQTLSEGDHFQISFWAGFMILVSALLTLLSLIATFTAWAMVNAVDEVNVHCIFRSSIGQYAAELPGRLIVCSIYTFLISFLLFFFLLLPTGTWSILLLCLAVSLFIHTVATLSQLGRLIVHSGAMGKRRIFEAQYEQTLLPQSLHTQLLTKAKANLANNTSIRRQYKLESQIPPMDRNYNEEEMIQLLQAQRNHSNHHNHHSTMTTTPYRQRADSTVRFEDEREISPEAAFSSYNHNNNNHSSSWSSTTPTSQEDKPTSSRASPVYYRDTPPPPSNQQLQRAPLPAPVRAEPSSLPPSFLQSASSSSIDQWLKQSTETINNHNDHGDNDATSSPLDGSSQTSRRHRPLPPLAGDSTSTTTPDSHNNNHLLITEEERLFNMDHGSDFNKDDDDSPTSITTDVTTTHEQSSLLGHSQKSPAAATGAGDGGSKSSTSSEQARGYGSSSLVHVDQIGMMKQQDRSSPYEKKWSG